jgi:2-aminoethylphosphonate dioxygenase
MNKQVPAGSLTAEQIRFFRDQGYVVVPKLFNADELSLITDWVEDVEGWPETAGKWMMYFEHAAGSKRLLNRIENLLPYHSGFNALAVGDKMQGACGQLFGEPAKLFKDKINFKKPGGGGFESHQDVQAGWSKYADLHITALISIDKTTVENGCLEMAGSHHDKGLLGEEWTPLDDGALSHLTYEKIEAEPGDAVFFDSFAPHRSEPNRSQSARRVLYYTYNKASEGDHLSQYYSDKRKSYPPDIERDADKEYVYRV